MVQKMMKTRSFISGSKKEKLFYLFKLVIFLLLVHFSNKALSFIFYDDTQTISRYAIHEAYSQEKPIDVAFLGTSVARDAINPHKMDGIIGDNVFNLATNSQTIKGTLYLLKEMNQNDNIKKAYVNIHYGIVIDDKNNRSEILRVARVFDYIKPTINKFSLLVRDSISESYIDLLVPARREIKYVFSKMYVTNLINQKLTYDYLNFSYPQKASIEMGFEYLGKGYTRYNDGRDPLICAPDSIIDFDDYSMNETCKEGLIEIIDYCNSHNIELIFYNAPLPTYHLLNSKNFDNYISQVKEFSEEHGIEYYDFNLVKPAYFDANMSYYRDEIHMCGKGGDTFSQLLADFFSGKISEQELFYNSWAEKLDDNPGKIYGYAYSTELQESGNSVVQIREVYTSQNPNPTYFTIAKSLDDSQAEIVEVMTTTPKIIIPKDEHGTIFFYTFEDASGEGNGQQYSFSY